jgi:hypothetical protein
MPHKRKKRIGFLIINTKTGKILSKLSKRREEVREELQKIVSAGARKVPLPGDVEYRGGRYYEPLGIHHVELYPGETYSSETYKP